MNITLKITLEFPEEGGRDLLDIYSEETQLHNQKWGVLHNECLSQYVYLLFQLSSAFYPIPFYICDNSLSK